MYLVHKSIAENRLKIQERKSRATDNPGYTGESSNYYFDGFSSCFETKQNYNFGVFDGIIFEK